MASYEYPSEDLKGRFINNTLEKKEKVDGNDSTLRAMLGDAGPVKTQTSTSSQTTSNLGLKTVQFTDPYQVEQLVKDLSTSGIDWVLFDYVTGGTEKVTVTKKGSGLIEGGPPKSVQDDLSDNKVQYLLGTTKQGARGYLFITWTGNKAPQVQQKASASHKVEIHGALDKLFQRFAGSRLQSGEMRC